MHTAWPPLSHLLHSRPQRAQANTRAVPPTAHPPRRPESGKQTHPNTSSRQALPPQPQARRPPCHPPRCYHQAPAALAQASPASAAVVASAPSGAPVSLGTHHYRRRRHRQRQRWRRRVAGKVLDDLGGEVARGLGAVVAVPSHPSQGCALLCSSAEGNSRARCRWRLAWRNGPHRTGWRAQDNPYKTLRVAQACVGVRVARAGVEGGASQTTRTSAGAAERGRRSTDPFFGAVPRLNEWQIERSRVSRRC